MIRSVGLGLFCLVLFVGTAATQDKKEDAKKEVKKDDVEWKMDYLEKTWGIKFKSATIGGPNDKGIINILLTFTKDVENVQEMKLAFKAPSTIKAQASVPIQFYMFDKDGVVILKTHIGGTIGELTGKEGDSFRVYLSGLENQIEQIRKVEPRPNLNPVEPPKTKAKGKR